MCKMWYLTHQQQNVQNYNVFITSPYVALLIANCTIRCINVCDVNNLLFFLSLTLVLTYMTRFKSITYIM